MSHEMLQSKVLPHKALDMNSKHSECHKGTSEEFVNMLSESCQMVESFKQLQCLTLVIYFCAI